MKARNFLMALALLLAGTGGAWAHGFRGNVGIYVGPGWGPWYYPSPFYYSPQVVVVPPSPPPVYIEQSEPAAPSDQQYWYYCRATQGYYPYVRECPEGWHKVLPQPAR